MTATATASASAVTATLGVGGPRRGNEHSGGGDCQTSSLEAFGIERGRDGRVALAS